MLPPTPENLQQYENWVKNKSQSKVFFSDLCTDAPIKIIVKPGNTLLLPSGWIHSVYTPLDSVVRIKRKRRNKVKTARNKKSQSSVIRSNNTNFSEGNWW